LKTFVKKNGVKSRQRVFKTCKECIARSIAALLKAKGGPTPY
jgi:hypothetical protein